MHHTQADANGGETVGAKHTTGPWRLDRGRDGRSEGYIRAASTVGTPGVGPHGMAVCRVTKSALPYREVEANGHLLAAAPDLYNACQHALYMLETEGMGDDELLEELRDAIARAEGKE